MAEGGGYLARPAPSGLADVVEIVLAERAVDAVTPGAKDEQP
jgi:hypothetical protein